jgi:hypothetical protein
MRAMSYRGFIRLASVVALASACAEAIADRAPVTGTSATMTVRGEIMLVEMDEVGGMAIRDGRLALRGSSGEVLVDLPAVADPGKPKRGWALVTETMSDEARTVTFTHETTLDDFTLDLPASDAHLYYGGLTGRNGEDVLVFAWGAGKRSYWGYVTIQKS